MSTNAFPQIPTPDVSNPAPRAGDVWFNYRSLQEVKILAIVESRVSLSGSRTGRTGTTDIEDFAVPRFFKFLRHEEPAQSAPAPPKETPMDRLIAAAREQVELQRRANELQAQTIEKLDRLLALWEGPRS